MNRIETKIMEPSDDGCTIQFNQLGGKDILSIRLSAFDAETLYYRIDEYLTSIRYKKNNPKHPIKKGSEVHHSLSDFKSGEVVYAYETYAANAAMFKIPVDVEDIDCFYTDLIIFEEGKWKPTIMGIICAGEDTDAMFRKATEGESKFYFSMIEEEKERIKNNINKQT